MCEEFTSVADEQNIDSIDGDEVLDALGAVEADEADYVPEDDVANAIARGEY